MRETTSCQSSLDAHEPIFATATEAKIWICLEYRGAWSAKAFATSAVTETVKRPLADGLAASPDSRIQLIRKPGRTRGPLTLYLARPNRAQPDAYRLDFARYGDLEGLDLRALAAGTPPPDARPEPTPWILVCGNGRRDVCCARHGTAVYGALKSRKGAEVWLSNHQGGHRFAANTVVLPAGVHIGRLRPESAQRVVERCLQGVWDLDHTRGHVAYPRPAQAAEHFLRVRSGDLRRDAYRLDSADALTPDRWRVRLSEADGPTHTLEVLVGRSDFEVLKTSGDPEPATVPRYSLV
jgi:hypothetical protein